MTPVEIDQMSPWQFAAAIIGWNAVHGSGDSAPAAMSSERFHALVEAYGDR